MKIIIAPIFKMLLATIIIFYAIFAYIITNIIDILWNFKITKWFELFNDAGYMYNYPNNTVYDKNIIQTFKRYYKLNYYF